MPAEQKDLVKLKILLDTFYILTYKVIVINLINSAHSDMIEINLRGVFWGDNRLKSIMVVV